MKMYINITYLTKKSFYFIMLAFLFKISMFLDPLHITSQNSCVVLAK